MGFRGPQPKGKVKIEWSPDFAYAIGLIVTDGCLSGGRHIIFTSKDFEQIENFQKALRIQMHIGKKSNGRCKEKKYYTVQVGDVKFFNFLESIGIHPAKSKTIAEITIPDEFFFDYLRGCFDGDGSTYSYWDPRWKSSFMFYACFASASQKHILWLQSQIHANLGIKGHINGIGKGICYQLKYAKRDSLILIKKMYYSENLTCLSRKKLKIERMLAIVGEPL